MEPKDSKLAYAEGLMQSLASELSSKKAVDWPAGAALAALYIAMFMAVTLGGVLLTLKSIAASINRLKESVDRNTVLGR